MSLTNTDQTSIPQTAVAPREAAKKTKAAKSGGTPSKAKTAKSKTAKAPASDDDRVIKLLTEGEANPRREGSDGGAHFEKMRGGVTVAAYLAKFPKEKRRVARHWLRNTVNDGYAKLVKAR
jgi:hypothetical protein